MSSNMSSNDHAAKRIKLETPRPPISPSEEDLQLIYDELINCWKVNILEYNFKRYLELYGDEVYNEPIFPVKRTLAHEAVIRMHEPLLKLLLSNPKVSVDAKDEIGYTPYLLCCNLGNVINVRRREWNVPFEMFKLLFSTERVNIDIASPTKEDGITVASLFSSGLEQVIANDRLDQPEEILEFVAKTKVNGRYRKVKLSAKFSDRYKKLSEYFEEILDNRQLR